jgi:ankyrin repeat protein
VVSHLLGQPGLELNAQDSDGMTALMHAARVGALEVCQEFFELILVLDHWKTSFCWM